MAFKGAAIHDPTPAAIMVREYFDRMMMKELGFRVPVKTLSQFDFICFRYIASEYGKLRNEEAKKPRKKK